MEERKRLSKGIRRHIRGLKADIRRSFGYTAEADTKLKDIYEKFFYPHTRISTPTKERPALSRFGVGVEQIIKDTPKVETVLVAKEKPEIKKIPHVKKSQPRSRKAVK